jgi:hypothetical protein
MTIEQENIRELFNSQDVINRELAEELAIATGNGQWFSEMIDYYISKIKAVIKKYCEISVFNNKVTLKGYDDIAILQLMFCGGVGDSFSGHFEMCTENITINDESYRIYFILYRKDDCCIYEEKNLQKELKEIGIEIKIY